VVLHANQLQAGGIGDACDFERQTGVGRERVSICPELDGPSGSQPQVTSSAKRALVWSFRGSC
jgi:hypothetical protein